MLLLLALFILPNPASALGFGTPVIESHLHEPLKGYVPLLLAETEHIKQIKVELATPAEYRRLGLQWNDSTAAIRILPPHSISGEVKIALSSVGAVKSPMLSIVLKASTTGRSTWYKHFRILLDPANIRLPAGNKPQLASIVPLVETQAPPEQRLAAGWARVWRYGPVRSGDSLSEIAYRLRRDKRWSNRQVMLSLYEENPDSFIARDIHRLKSGAWLSVPSAQTVRKNGSTAALDRLKKLIQSKPEPSGKRNAVAAAAGKEHISGKLRYSGLIAVKKALGNRQAKRADDESSGKIPGYLKAIHAEVMSSKLQMDQLGKTVEGLGKSMTELKVDMKALRQDVVANRQAPKALKQEILGLRQDVAGMKKSLSESLHKTTGAASFSSGNAPIATNNWALAFFVLLTACTGFLIGSVYQRRKRKQWKTPETVSTQQPAQIAVAVAQSETSADAITRIINNIEESLNKCEYEHAEQTLDELDRLAPDSLQASVLRIQLYHETKRPEQRDRLISAVGEESDESRWERFCHQLPSHVWNDCFGDGSARLESPQPDHSAGEKK